MAKCKQRIVNVLADEGYTSMGGGKWLEPVLAHDNVDGVFLYEFNEYSKLEGKIDFVNGKPVIGGRFNLWSPNFYDVEGWFRASKARAHPVYRKSTREYDTHRYLDRTRTSLLLRCTHPPHARRAGLVKALQAVPNLTDASSSSGYSVIPVHAWSHNVSDIKAAAALLSKDGRFDVVLPEELLARVSKYVTE